MVIYGTKTLVELEWSIEWLVVHDIKPASVKKGTLVTLAGIKSSHEQAGHWNENLECWDTNRQDNPEVKNRRVYRCGTGNRKKNQRKGDGE